MDNIWLAIFCFVCLHRMKNSFKHVRFIILIVLNKNAVIRFYLEECWQEINANISATVTLRKKKMARRSTIGPHYTKFHLQARKGDLKNRNEEQSFEMPNVFSALFQSNLYISCVFAPGSTHRNIRSVWRSVWTML